MNFKVFFLSYQTRTWKIYQIACPPLYSHWVFTDYFWVYAIFLRELRPGNLFEKCWFGRENNLLSFRAALVLCLGCHMLLQVKTLDNRSLGSFVLLSEDTSWSILCSGHYAVSHSPKIFMTELAFVVSPVSRQLLRWSLFCIYL